MLMANHQDHCEICRRIDDCRFGRHAGLIAEVDTGFAVLGDSQQFRGYSLLLCRTPATELDELPSGTRLRYLEEMSQLAEAVRRVVRPHKINYECLGNQVHHLHFHVFPRQLSDPQPTMPVWGQMLAPGSPEGVRARFDPGRDRELLSQMRDALAAIRLRDGAGGVQQSAVASVISGAESMQDLAI